MRRAFTFYGSYYESIKDLPLKNQLELYKGIIEYSFEKKEQDFKGISNSIWVLIKPNIDNNISKYENGKILKRNESEMKAKDKRSESNALSLSLSLSNKSYYNNIELNNIFIEYLSLRKKLKAVNSDRAIKMLIDKLSKYDDETKLEMINQSIVHSWKDVYELKNKTPNWFNKEIKKEEMTKEELAELEESFKEFK